jgi:hypothetical protein
MNDSKNSSNGLLVLKVAHALTGEDAEKLTAAITPTAEALGVEPMVLPPGADIRIENGRDALLERVCVALEALVAQGQPPELSEPQIAPQALNARQEVIETFVNAALRTPVGLNPR